MASSSRSAGLTEKKDEIVSAYISIFPNFFEDELKQYFECCGNETCKKSGLIIVNEGDDCLQPYKISDDQRLLIDLINDEYKSKLEALNKNNPLYKEYSNKLNRIEEIIKKNIPPHLVGHYFDNRISFVKQNTISMDVFSGHETPQQEKEAEFGDEYVGIPTVDYGLFTSIGRSTYYPLSYFLNGIVFGKDRNLKNIVGISLLQAKIRYELLKNAEEKINAEEKLKDPQSTNNNSVSQLASRFYINERFFVGHQAILNNGNPIIKKDGPIKFNVEKSTGTINVSYYYIDLEDNKIYDFIIKILNEEINPQVAPQQSTSSSSKTFIEKIRELLKSPKNASRSRNASEVSKDELIAFVTANKDKMLNKYTNAVKNIRYILKTVTLAQVSFYLKPEYGGYPRKIRNPKTGRLVKSTGEKGLDVRKKKEIGKKISEGMKRSASKKRASSTDSRKKAPVKKPVAKKAPTKARSTKKPAAAKKPVKKSAKKPAAKKPVKKSWGLF